MIRRVAGFDRDESAAASGAHFIMSNQFAFNHRAITRRFDYASYEPDWLIGRRRAAQADGVIGSYGARSP